MKKIIICLFIAVLVINLSAQKTSRIKVLSPRSGDQWKTKSIGIVKWRNIGSPLEYIKIDLYSTNNRFIINIVDRLRNRGLNNNYRWNIPNSLNPGNYKIRVQSLDQQVKETSNVFRVDRRIANETIHNTQNPAEQNINKPKPDLQISDFKVDNSRNLIVTVTSGFIGYYGNLKFKIRSYNNRVYYAEINNLRIHSRRTKNIPIYTFSENYLYEWNKYCGYRIAVIIDPNNSVAESNENNNRKSKTIYYKDNLKGLKVQIGRNPNLKYFRRGRIQFNASELHGKFTKTYTGYLNRRTETGRKLKIPSLDVRIRIVNCCNSIKSFKPVYSLGIGGIFSNTKGYTKTGGSISLNPNESREIYERLTDITITTNGKSGPLQIQFIVSNEGERSYSNPIFSAYIKVKPDFPTKFK